MELLDRLKDKIGETKAGRKKRETQGERDRDRKK